MEYYDSNDSQYNKQPENENDRRNTKQTNPTAIASMICGLCGTLLLCSCIAFPLAIILGVSAIVLAIMSKKGQPFSGYAIAGLIFGIIAALFGVLECIYLIALNVLLRDPEWAPFFDEVMRQYEAMMPTA